MLTRLAAIVAEPEPSSRVTQALAVGENILVLVAPVSNTFVAPFWMVVTPPATQVTVESVSADWRMGGYLNCSPVPLLTSVLLSDPAEESGKV